MATTTASKKIFHFQRGETQTLGNTTTTLDSYTLPANSAVAVEVFICVRNGNTTSTDKAALFKQVASAGRVSGSAVLVGTADAVTPIIDATLAGITLTIDVSGNDVRLRATGLAATTIFWQYEWKIIVN